MYIPKHTAMPDQDRQLAFMRANSFAVVVSHVDGALFATHVPVRSQLGEDGRVLLSFHLAKANPQSEALLTAPETLVIFNGPHAYISPSNYEKADVPTWNYVAVHATGTVAPVDDHAGKLALLADLIGHYEAAFQAEWDGMSERFRDGMLAGIRGFVVTVTQLEGKAKLSQNRSVADQTQVAEWLANHAHETQQAVGAMMKARLENLDS